MTTAKKRLRKRRTVLTITLDQPVVDLIDFYADGLQRPRAEVMRGLIHIGLNDPKTMNALGVLKLKDFKETGVIQFPLGHFE